MEQVRMSKLRTIELDKTRELHVVGKSVSKPDAWEKAKGGSGYPVNFRLPRMLHAKLLRSPYAHARIVKIETSKAQRLRGVRAIITHKDVPKASFTPYYTSPPMALTLVRDLLVLDDRVRFVGDGVAAVAAETVEEAEEALDLIDVEYEQLPAVFDPEEAMKPGAPEIHQGVKNNAAISPVLSFGDVERGFEEAGSIFEGKYETPRVSTCYMEPRVCVTQYDDMGNLTVYSSIQAIFGLRQALSVGLGMPESRINVIKPPYIGGGFGGKLEMSFLEPVCSLLSIKTGRPVRMEYTRSEDFLSSSRHRIRMYLKTGVKKDGSFTARYCRSVLDAGAHATQAPVVIMVHGTFGFLGTYKCANRKWEGYCVYTNNVIGGGYRGYGAPQAAFAVESQIDEICEELKLDPIEMRLKNCHSQGDPHPEIPELNLSSYALRDCISEGATRLAWGQRSHPEGKSGMVRRGIGFACVPIWVSGGYGIPDVYEHSGAVVKVNPDGTVSLNTGVVDIGGGQNTAIMQIVAEELGVPFEAVKLTSSDTDNSPFDSGTHASRVTYAAGYAARLAAAEAKRKLLGVAGELLKADPADLEIENGDIYLRGTREKKTTVADVATAAHLPSVIITENGPQVTVSKKGTIMGAVSSAPPANPTPTAALFVEVEVDTETGEVRVLRAISTHDLGRAINPKAAEGQVEGGFVQGLGYALMEEMLFDQETGTCLTLDFLDYKIPTAMEVPRIESVLLEAVEETGPFGAKGIGEPPIIMPAPAIANAVYNAVGVRIRELPITPEKILKALGKL